MNSKGWFRPAFVRATLVIGGVLYIASAIALLFAPEWFLEQIGLFPPLNRHYMGDAGSFVLALGAGLVWAARDPLKHRLMVAAGLLGTLVHTINHAYGDIVLAELPGSDIVRDLAPLLVYAILLTVATWFVLRSD